MTSRCSRCILKHGEKFHHDFNVKHIASVEAKQLKVSEKKRRPRHESSRAFKQIPLT